MRKAGKNYTRLAEPPTAWNEWDRHGTMSRGFMAGRRDGGNDLRYTITRGPGGKYAGRYFTEVRGDERKQGRSCTVNSQGVPHPGMTGSTGFTSVAAAIAAARKHFASYIGKLPKGSRATAPAVDRYIVTFYYFKQDGYTPSPDKHDYYGNDGHIEAVESVDWHVSQGHGPKATIHRVLRPGYTRPIYERKAKGSRRVSPGSKGRRSATGCQCPPKPRRNRRGAGNRASDVPLRGPKGSKLVYRAKSRFSTLHAFKRKDSYTLIYVSGGSMPQRSLRFDGKGALKKLEQAIFLWRSIASSRQGHVITEVNKVTKGQRAATER